MRRKNKMIAVVTGIALSAILLCGCGEKQDSAVNIGYFNNITHAQALYMKAQGTLEEAVGDEIDVVWNAFNAGPAEVEALFS